MGKRVRIVHRSFVSLIVAGIVVAAVSGCNRSQKLSQTPENPPQPVQKADEGSPAAVVKEAPAQQPSVVAPAVAVTESPAQKPDEKPPAAVTAAPVQQPDAGTPAAVKETPVEKPEGDTPAAAVKEAPAQKPEDNSPAVAVKEPPAGVVARIGEFEITKDELIRELLQAIQPNREEYAAPRKPVTAEAVALDLVAEKAMMMEGRKLGALDDPLLHAYIERQKKTKLGSMVVMDYIRKNLTVSEADIDAAMKSNSQLTREQASTMAQRTKGMAMLEQFYKELCAKFHLKQMTENFAKASEIHERLLRNPAKPRKEPWILNSQAREEVTKEEKAMVLASYDGGEVVFQDWMETLCEMAPPRRPQDLATVDGVGRLLDRTLRSALLVAEAKARGYEKDPDYMREIKELEDQQTLYKVQSDKMKNVAEPNEGQIKAFYEKNKDWFAEGPFLKVDQIWCKDLAAAQEVKQKLDSGADFKAMKDAHSLQKDVEPYRISLASEGPLWDELWKGEPNQVVGPVKGFYEAGLAWRVVKILEKTPAQEKPYSQQLGDTIKWMMMSEQRKAILDQYSREVREKYSYEVYADRLQGIDPLDPALYEQIKQ